MNTTAPLAGLTSYGMTRDETSGSWVPRIYDEPGIIHAVHPTPTEPQMANPYFIEETQNYRAAVCGALVKVVMPSTFKPAEEGACPECIEDLAAAVPPQMAARTPTFLPPAGDSWYSHGALKNPNYSRRREAERKRRQGGTA
ncbi:hypothetical protein [Paenarthrobacter sp. NPDC090522]|uniref:hypothetical protein n=1 Tax=Paenarthrobacter sp. NPDC090522 TaxID=3364383 RepID=UPI003804EB57